MTDPSYLQTPEQWKRFLSAFTHELRTPLASLRMLAELLAGAPQSRLGDQEKRYTETIQEVVQDIQTLVGHVAELSSLLAGRVQPRPQEVAVEALVDQVREAVQPLAWERQIVLQDSLDAALPPLLLIDPHTMRQTMTLLVDAAVGHARSKVSLRLERDGGNLRVVISSDGPPFPEEALQSAFEPFDGVRTGRQRGGRSLALPLANELTRALGGTLGIGNREGAGTFEISLPLDGPPPAAV